ncbi:hypothetical protein KA344_16135 [bacterium]|jgi:hypothetical protein|nr:hypothetical protein [bacterium]
MTNSAKPWLLKQDGDDSMQTLARSIYKLVCRKDFTQPGFALVRQSGVTTSSEQRQSICSLKEALSELYFEDSARNSAEKLDWFNLNRFDQQNSTKPHRDGAPEESLLILGYEPSAVKSELSMSDYSKLAHEMGLSPNQFLEDHNPMYNQSNELLTPFTTRLTEFNPQYFQLVIVNNSSAPVDAAKTRWQGVLHCAKVQKLEGAQRVINSTVVCPLKYLTSDVHLNEDQAKERERWFLTSLSLQENTYK